MCFDRQTMSIDHYATAAREIKVIKTALVGADGLLMIVFEELVALTNINRFRMFSNTQEALDWLIDANQLCSEIVSREMSMHL